MQLNRDTHQGEFTIKSYSAGALVINDTEIKHSVIVSKDAMMEWQIDSIEALSHEHLSPILALKPQILLLGTGPGLVFPSQALLAPLINQQIGLEIMDTNAASRTFNLLMAEDRYAIAALIV